MGALSIGFIPVIGVSAVRNQENTVHKISHRVMGTITEVNSDGYKIETIINGRKSDVVIKFDEDTRFNVKIDELTKSQINVLGNEKPQRHRKLRGKTVKATHKDLKIGDNIMVNGDQLNNETIDATRIRKNHSNLNK